MLRICMNIHILCVQWMKGFVRCGNVNVPTIYLCLNINSKKIFSSQKHINIMCTANTVGPADISISQQGSRN